MPEYAANKTNFRVALIMLEANGLTPDQAMELKNEAEQKKGERAFGHGGWMTAHADDTYSSGAA